VQEFEVTHCLFEHICRLCCTILGMVYSYNGGILVVSGAKGKLGSAVIVGE